jgi:hypothetical protein
MSNIINIHIPTDDQLLNIALNHLREALHNFMSIKSEKAELAADIIYTILSSYEEIE